MSKTYIVISLGPDGTGVELVDKAELENRLNEEYYGSNLKYYSCIPEDLDHAEGLIIIEGKVVVPAQVTTVTKWEMA